jgi:hypothetical protein
VAGLYKPDKGLSSRAPGTHGRPGEASPEGRGPRFRRFWHERQRLVAGIEDLVVKGMHSGEFICWYQRGCDWKVYVKAGLVLREEKAATYAQTHVSQPVRSTKILHGLDDLPPTAMATAP